MNASRHLANKPGHINVHPPTNRNHHTSRQQQQHRPHEFSKPQPCCCIRTLRQTVATTQNTTIPYQHPQSPVASHPAPTAPSHDHCAPYPTPPTTNTLPTRSPATVKARCWLQSVNAQIAPSPCRDPPLLAGMLVAETEHMHTHTHSQNTHTLPLSPAHTGSNSFNSSSGLLPPRHAPAGVSGPAQNLRVSFAAALLRSSMLMAALLPPAAAVVLLKAGCSMMAWNSCVPRSAFVSGMWPLTASKL